MNDPFASITTITASTQQLVDQAAPTILIYARQLKRGMKELFPSATDKEILAAIPGLAHAASLDFTGAIITRSLQELTSAVERLDPNAP